MPQAGFEPTFPASGRPQTHAVGHAAGTGTGTGLFYFFFYFNFFFFTSRNISDLVIVILLGMTSSGTRENTQKKNKKM